MTLTRRVWLCENPHGSVVGAVYVHVLRTLRLYCNDPLPAFGFDFELADGSCWTKSSHIIDAEILISWKWDEFTHSGKQLNLNPYEFLVLFYICNRKLRIPSIIWAEIQLIWNVQKGVLDLLKRDKFSLLFSL